jgi:riboflavin kinase/FMN adenylyltransferase
LLAKLRSRSRSLGVGALAVSFEPHPLTLLRPQLAPTPLVWPERKATLLRAAGADQVLLMHTTPALLALTAEEFFQKVLQDRLDVQGLVEGANFGFGRDRRGDAHLLGRLCAEAGLPLDVVELVSGFGQEVSSSRIRAAVLEGRVDEAASLLGRPHRIRGKVVVGDQRGSKIGFPTANLGDVDVVLPAEGVYAVRGYVQGRPFAGAANLGPNPTFSVDERKVEVHLMEFTGDLYGSTLEVDFLARLRETRKFAGIDDLKNQLAADVAQAKSIAEKQPAGKGAFASLSLTIAEWVRMRLASKGDPTRPELAYARLSDDGRLALRWILPSPMTPSDAYTLLMGMETPLRRDFPEIQSIESSADRPGPANG